MGEYITLDGQDFKLGTCEDMYYIRHADLAAAVKAGRTRYRSGNANPAEYLKPGWRFRFPFPDEDNIKPGEYENFDRGLVVSVPRDYYGPDAEHEHITHSIHAAGGGYNVNTWTPCPASPAFFEGGRTSSPLPAWLPLELVRQKTMEGGQLWTVCRCGWCGWMFRLPEEDAAKLCALIEAHEIGQEKDEHRRAYWQEVCRRIMAGYTKPAAEFAAILGALIEVLQ